MEDFAQSINAFLAFHKYEILKDKGKVSMKTAQKKAEEQYERFNRTQRIVSDFDKEVKKFLEKGGEDA
jgi:hypothetical protein